MRLSQIQMYMSQIGQYISKKVNVCFDKNVLIGRKYDEKLFPASHICPKYAVMCNKND